MNLISDKEVTIFKREENGKAKYVFGLSNKNADGTYDNAYFPIQFNKGVVLEDKTKIFIKKAWLSFYRWNYQDKQGITYFAKCSEFTEQDYAMPDDMQYQDVKTRDVESDEIVLTDDDLPF